MAKSLREALDEMPTSVDGIVALFEQMGIKATTKEGLRLCNTCPVAVYLSKVTGLEVGVSPWFAGDPSDSETNYTLPHAVVDFISSYDHGNLPQFLPEVKNA